MLRSLALTALLLAIGGATQARTYWAERYDSRVEVLRGGAILVTETITLHFDSGSFTQFFRMIPARMTDGVEFVSASMDGQPASVGEGPGQVRISGSSRVRVTWRFEPTSNASHVVALTYRVRGVVRRESGADVFGWRLLPGEHGYRIDAARSEIVLPAAPASPPTIDARRVGQSTVTVQGSRVLIDASNIRPNGWTEARVSLPPGSVIDAPPAWQQHENDVRSTAGPWALGAGLVFLSAMALLFAVRQRYDSPSREPGGTARWTSPPDDLSPVLAGALVTNGEPQLEHAMAAIFLLADRGEVTIEETKRTFGHLTFALTRKSAGRTLASFEQAALDIIFTGKQGPERSVSLSTARSRMMRHFRKFKTAVIADLQATGLLDDDRRAVRRSFLRSGIALVIAGAVAPLAVAPLLDRYGAWPLLIAAALILAAAIAFICYSAHTPLSNDGLRRSEPWAGFRKYLRAVARDREASPGDADCRRWLSYAVALGTAAAWSAYLKRHRAAAPPWFHAASDAGGNSGATFAAFVGMGGASSGSHGHNSGGGSVAGGGASGAS
jgi:hypothetical protein